LATKILAKVANWRPADLKRNLLEKLSKIPDELINSTSGGITCLSLFSSPVVQKVDCVNLTLAAAQNGKFDRFEGV